MPTLALLDGHSLAYRAFFALPSDLATTGGQVTNAVYGFTSMLIKLLGEHHPEALAVAWDSPGGTFRNEEYEEYKANREAAPDIFSTQLPLIGEVAAALAIRQIRAPGFEADDIIATLARAAEAEGWDVIIVTGDRDAFQLIDERVRVLYTRRGISDTVVADAGYVEERYGIAPDQYPEYAALRGDTSDNLPGVPGVGEKTATKLLQNYGSLAGIFEHVKEQSPKLSESLADSREQVLLNHRLITLATDVPLAESVDDLVLAEWSKPEVREVFERLEFHSLWERLLEAAGGTAEAAFTETLAADVVTLTAAGEVKALAEGGLTLDPVWEGDGLAGLMVAGEEDMAAFVPAPALQHLGGALADPQVGKRVHDAKPLLSALIDQDLDLVGLEFDTALAAYVLNPAQRAYGLEEVAGRFLRVELDPAAAAEGAQGTLDFEGGPDLENLGRRVLAVGRLVEPLTEQLQSREAWDLYREVELPLVRVLARMEDAGIGVDVAYLEELGEGLRDRLAALETKIHQAAGEPFNVNSTLQLREVLFDRLQLPVLKKTPKGQPSTDASVLVKLAEEHPIVELLLSYRELEKLRSTYVDGLLPLVRTDGRIHAHFNQMAAATGRLSSENPNMQNIPVRSEEGRAIRRAFIPTPEWTFLVADYSQIELRILAHLSRDPGLLEAFAAGEDIHTATAARTFGVDAADVTGEMRRRAKVINFGLLYGMEAFGLAQRLEIEREEAEMHMDQYFSQFPLVREFMEGIVADAHNDGYTTTIFGRRRYLPELTSNNYRIRQMGERMALNAPIQGSAADIIKMAMIRLDHELEPAESMMLLQIHDELVLECPPSELEDMSSTVRAIMEGVADLAVPLTVDVATGANLAETKA